jgi:hypothetical protein
MKRWNWWTLNSKIRLLNCLSCAFGVALLSMAAPAAADEAYKITSVISLPGGQKLTSVDIGFTAPGLGLYAVSDRKNKAVDVFDTTTNTLLFQTTGFCGLAGSGTCTGSFATEAGGNGVIFVDNKEIWVGDGNSTVKVVDLVTKTITHTIALGGTKRSDELCHDPVDHVVLVANDRAVDNFVTFINTQTYTVIKKVVLDGTGGYPKATNGIEQCQWSPRTGLFYLAVPEINGAGDDQTPGAVIVISPTTQKVLATFALPLTSCAGPQGMAIGPAPQILLGCSANGPATAIIDERDGHVLASFQGLNGNDEVYFNSTDNHYFLSESNAATPQLAIIDALALTPGPSIPIPPGHTSVAADSGTGNVYVPIINTPGANICSTFGGIDANGCIAVFTSASGAAKIFGAVAPTARTTTTGLAVTAFASIINASTVTATSCSIQLPAGVPADFKYQTTDKTTNKPTGTPNSPVDIPAGASQTFYFAVTPTAAFTQDIPLTFVCDNSDPAPSFPGLNTFLVTSTNPPVADMLTITDTLSHDGYVMVTGTSGMGVMAAATMDIAAAGTVTFTPTDTPFGQAPRNLPVTLTICQTNPGTGACLTTPGPSTTVSVTSGQVLSFTIFVQGQGKALANIPGFNRVFLVSTQGNIPVGQSSAAVKN